VVKVFIDKAPIMYKTQVELENTRKKTHVGHQTHVCLNYTKVISRPYVSTGSAQVIPNGGR